MSLNHGTGIPYDTHREYEAIRRDGKVNMNNISDVKKVAISSGFHYLLKFINNHSREEYIELGKKAFDVYGNVQSDQMDKKMKEIPGEIRVEVRISGPHY